MTTDHDLILIIDCGAQYRQLIARRVREHLVYSEIVPHTATAAELTRPELRGIIVTGGPASVYDDGALRIDPGIYELGVPVLGICYGMQLMALQLGGNVARAGRHEYGRASLDVTDDGRLFAGLGTRLDCWMSHGDHVLDPPPGFSILGSTDNAPISAIGDPNRGFYGVQFHPEVVHTQRGQEILGNFLFRVCNARPTWTMSSFIDRTVDQIRERVGDGRVLCGLSGGVDSSVTAALVHRAIGDRLTCLFVDHGLMRKQEPESIVATFKRFPGLNFRHVDASDRFLARLAGVTDPEEKRKIVGTEFIRVFERECVKLGDIRFLAQGTLYPDVIESGTPSSALIKSHHNVGGLPDDMNLELVEPLRELFKDEVRELGAELGLPATLVWRQPFPGPGLSIRVIGDVTRDKLDILRDADAIVTGEIARAGLDREIWQSFAILVSVRTVGVQGDDRSYAYPIIVRAVTSSDGMTADWARMPADLLERISSRIIDEVPHVNRVAFDITPKPPGTIEWE